VVYVWLDALTNYTTGIGYDADGNNGELYKKYWPADLHLIGKDIVRFHTIYWPIFLMALGEPLPKQVFGHPWLLQAGGKMSKSKGNVLYADELVSFFGVDPVRYFCLHEMPFENDGSISWDLMVERYNADLANVLGNLVSRTIAMTNKYFGGVVERPEASFSPEDAALDADLEKTVLDGVKKIREKMDVLRVADAMTELWNIFKRCNKYIDETLPWALAKDESKQDRLKAVLYHLTEALTIGASLLFSFMPETSEKILKELGTEKRALEAMDTFGLYPSGTRVAAEAEMLFRRLDPKEVEAKLNAENAAAEEAAAEEEKAEAPKSEIQIPSKPEVEYDAFAQCEFRVCKVLKCEEVPKSKKLLCFRLDCGGKEIQILSGIKKWYPEPEKLVGKRVMAIVNLKPARLAGMESQGMLLSAADENGNLSLMTTMSEDMPSGAEIG
jgi:methionine--tRNA ligase, beta subunit